MNRKFLFVPVTVLALLGAERASAADFALAFEGCPAEVIGEKGAKVSFEVFATLTTTNNTDPDGAQGWSLAIAVEGGNIRPDDPLTEDDPDTDPIENNETGIILEGVSVSTIFDHDNKATTPDRNPSALDLGAAGFVVAELTTPGSPAQGAVSAIVLHQTQKRVLQPDGTQRVARLIVEGTIPNSDTPAPLTIRFQNGLIGSGQPVNNVATFKGASNIPTLGSCTVMLTPPPPPPPADFILAIVPVGGTSVSSGDNLLEATRGPGIHDFECLVTLKTERLEGTDGPQGWSLAVAHDPCMQIRPDDPTTVDDPATEEVDENIDETGVIHAGVVVSTIFDHDNKATTPPRDPSPLDLASAGFVVNEVTSPASPRQGAVSAIVLHQTQKRVLHPNATDPLLKLVYRFELTPAQIGQTIECKASISDGLVGSGQPVNNVITQAGQSQKATRFHNLVFKITVQQPPQKDGFLRGDANDDGKVNIADVVWIVSDVVDIGQPTTCPDSGDANDDEAMNLADAVFIINWQFMGSQVPPLAPFPACGTDGDSSETTCPPESTGCPTPTA